MNIIKMESNPCTDKLTDIEYLEHIDTTSSSSSRYV